MTGGQPFCHLLKCDKRAVPLSSCHMNMNNTKYGFIKPAVDAHTMGIVSVAELLRDCGYEVLIADDPVAGAMNDYRHELRRRLVVDWIAENEIERLGISYRLDRHDAVNMVGFLIEELKKAGLLKYQGGRIDSIFFGGLPDTCELINKEFKGLVETFIGGESATETLLKLGVPPEKIPPDLKESSRYDNSLLTFGREIIKAGEYTGFKPAQRPAYPEYGTTKDTVLKRFEAGMRRHPFLPLIRAHVGPYSSEATRTESINEFVGWAKNLAESGWLDILSIGSSQLTQSNFGEDWEDRPNGGGVPVNSPEEYRMIWEAARPLLVRTYAGTKNIPALARMHEETLNICWHAMSLWWFNRLDERGPYDLLTSLRQQFEAIRYIAETGKPFEANVSHHFAFRGADDVTYIVSACLAAKLAKKLGIKTFILQNMLNTPRTTWGVQDLAKSRAMLQLVKSLEDSSFKVLLQPRAGLDYFRPDLNDAKAQLAAVTALMDDIDPHNELSPPIIHVVSFSEALQLATPEIINESIQITLHSLRKYRELRKKGDVEDMSQNIDVSERQADLYSSALKVISAIEESIDNVYTPEGFYKIFASGFLPVPYLWGETEEFQHAKNWKTKPVRGGIKIVDSENKVIKTDRMIEVVKANLQEFPFGRLSSDIALK